MDNNQHLNFRNSEVSNDVNNNNMLDKLNVFILPKSFFDIIKINNLNIVDIFNYSKIRRYLSFTELADLVFYNNLKLENVSLTHSSVIFDLFKVMTDAEKVELQTSVVPLATTEEIANSCNNTLTDINCKYKQDCYSFVKNSNTLFIILDKGFLNNACNDKNFYSDFIKNYVKQLYAMVAIAEVSKLPIFKSYLQVIKQQ